MVIRNFFDNIEQFKKRVRDASNSFFICGISKLFLFECIYRKMFM